VAESCKHRDEPSGSGATELSRYFQTLIKVGLLHGHLNSKDLLPRASTVSRNIQKVYAHVD
jgi:hypothetical protein